MEIEISKETMGSAPRVDASRLGNHLPRRWYLKLGMFISMRYLGVMNKGMRGGVGFTPYLKEKARL